MKFVIDMNLSPNLCSLLHDAGWESIHWSDVGMISAPDVEIMQWALLERRIVLTHDLDFGALLALTAAAGPSVVQVRTQDVRPNVLAPLLVPVLRKHETELDSGALLIVDEARSRVRILPLARR
jgi:predicted nuclease of predicted toxin-antitoxin system